MIKVIGLIVILLGFSCSTQSQQQTQLDEVEENSEQGNADDTSSDSEGNSNNSSNNNEYDENSTNSNDSEGNSAADESSEETGDSSEDYAGGDEEIMANQKTQLHQTNWMNMKLIPLMMRITKVILQTTKVVHNYLMLKGAGQRRKYKFC